MAAPEFWTSPFPIFFSNQTPRRPLPSYNAQLTCVHRRLLRSRDQNGLGRKINLQAKKKMFYIFWFIYLWSRRKKSFAQQAERWAAYVLDFSSKWETPIICHKEAPEKAIKNSDIFFILFSNFEEEIIISERGDSMTRINKLFSNLGLKTEKTTESSSFLSNLAFHGRKKWLFIPTDK